MVKIIRGDVTTIAVSVVVNAANTTLLGGGGVDGMIHYAAGSELLDECRTLGGCEKGMAKLTKGYNLPAKYIIHTVGPMYGRESGNEATILRNCYYNALELARQHKLRSIAFPSISTGCYGYPKEEAAKIAIATAKDYITVHPRAFDEIVFVSFSDLDFQVYQAVYATGGFTMPS